VEKETKIQRAINVIEKKPGIRTADLAAAIGVPPAKVAPLIFAATNSRFVLTCKVERPGLAPVNEYRLSAGVRAGDWDEYRSVHAAEQVRAKRAGAYRRGADFGTVKAGDAARSADVALSDAPPDDLQDKIEGMSERIASLQIELEAAQAAGDGEAAGYLVRASKCKPRVFVKRESAVRAAMATAGSRGRADVLALVPVGTARRKIAASVDWSGS
jgi:hypothetical protein